MKWVFTTITGLFLTDAGLNILEHIPFKNQDDYINRQIHQESLIKRHKDAKLSSIEQQKQFLPKLKDKKFFPSFHQQNIASTINQIRNSINEDLIITHTISNIDELDKASNLLTKRLREWYELYLPEISNKIRSHEAFVNLITQKSKKELLEELNLTQIQSMGAELKKEDLNEIMLLAQLIQNAHKLRERHLLYLESIMQKYSPNLFELCGATIAAKLIQHAGSLRRLALLPSSTVQLLGAEKALFRHLTQKAKSPKHGLIHEHPLLQRSKKQLRGKVARALADKISICARLDYFKGEFKAKEYKKELEEKFK